MALSKAEQAVKQYKNLGLQGEIEAASPHRLIQMLMDGLLAKIVAARYCIGSNNIAGKGENISMAISIVGGLRASLDMDKGGDIAGNLDNLYDYMERRLLEANLRSDVMILDEIMGLVNEIKSAWDAIGSELVASQQVS